MRTKIIQNDRVLVPSFHLHKDGEKTLEDRFKETTELRKKLSQNMLDDYYEDEQRFIDGFCGDSGG